MENQKKTMIFCFHIGSDILWDIFGSESDLMSQDQIIRTLKNEDNNMETEFCYLKFVRNSRYCKVASSIQFWTLLANGHST